MSQDGPTIFATVGAQMPFDRLIRAVDAWAGAAPGRAERVFAQIGPDAWVPQRVRHARFLAPTEFRSRVESAGAIVAHAGMGSILTALELGKPILVMPRRGALRETRNDHQVATAKRLQERGLVAVAWDETEVGPALDALERRGSERTGTIAPVASEGLIRAIRDFIATCAPGAQQATG